MSKQKVVKLWLVHSAKEAKIEQAGFVDHGDGNVCRPVNGWMQYHAIGKTVFGTQSEAYQAAMAQRDRRIASLERQLAKLRETEIEVIGLKV